MSDSLNPISEDIVNQGNYDEYGLTELQSDFINSILAVPGALEHGILAEF